MDILQEIEEANGPAHVNRRVAASALFGMMNWIYNWYNPLGDIDVGLLAEQYDVAHASPREQESAPRRTSLLQRTSSSRLAPRDRRLRVSRKAQRAAGVLPRMECDSDEAGRSARQPSAAVGRTAWPATFGP
jgi:hypothetical protein